MPSSDVAAADLWPAITDFTNPTRERITLDDGTTKDVTVDSLWSQLTEATGRGGGLGSQPPGSRLPLSVDTVDLVHEVRRTVVQLLKESNRRVLAARRALIPADSLSCPAPPRDPSGDVPIDLRRLRKRYEFDPLRAAALAADIRGWMARARAVLQLDRGQSAYLRLRCMVCQATVHPEVGPDGATVQRPALRLEWSGDNVRAAVCRACSTVMWPGEDFHALMAWNEELNRTKETLTG